MITPVPTSQLFWTAGVLAFTFAAANYANWPAAFSGAYLITALGIPTTLYSMAGSADHIGVAGGAPAIYLSDVLLACAVLAIWAEGGRLKIGWLVTLFALPSIFLLLTVWGNTLEQWAGFKLYATALLTFGVGRWLSNNLSDRAAQVAASACLIPCALQFTVVIAQFQGIALPGVGGGDATWITGGRMVGLFGHPATLGKNVFLLLCFLLPLSSYPKQRIRALAYAAISLGSFATLLTLARANVAAICAAIIVWTILSRRTASLPIRLGIILAAGTLVAVNSTAVTQLRERQQLDPNGGYRSRFIGVALDQISEAPLTGTGPNYYIEVVGRYDQFSAAGYPVHNTFLFVIVELGIVLAMILLTPVFITLSAAATGTARSKKLSLQAATLLAVLPGLIVITWTGWGILTGSSLPLWFMGFGFLASGTDSPVASKATLADDTRGAVWPSAQDSSNQTATTRSRSDVRNR